MKIRIAIFVCHFALAPYILAGCRSFDSPLGQDAAGDTSADSDTSITADGDADSDSDADPDADTIDPDHARSYIWIANTGEGTLSKVDTQREIEVARYITSPLGFVAGGDPSRTTVNRYGDAVVLNRRHPTLYDASTPSSVTKFAADIEDCIDNNMSGDIDTSTGPDDVREWGEDECMLWHTSLGSGVLAARAAAWDGEEDPDTGIGGHVWVGTCAKLERPGAQDYIFKLDGDTGEIIETIEFSGCAYGAAMDRDGGVWFVDRAAQFALHRLNTATLEIETVATEAGYGITIDMNGNIWSAGDPGCNRISRFNPSSSTPETLVLDTSYSFPRGAGTGVALSAGYVWVAENSGYLLKFDESTFTLVDAYPLGTVASPETIGIGIDFQGYVWIISRTENAAFKFDPETNTYVTIPVGTSPYTYSDMTGVQLINQVPLY